MKNEEEVARKQGAKRERILSHRGLELQSVSQSVHPSMLCENDRDWNDCVPVAAHP